LTSRKHVGTRLVIIDILDAQMDVNMYRRRRWISSSGKHASESAHTRTYVTERDFCLQCFTSGTRLPTAHESSDIRELEAPENSNHHVDNSPNAAQLAKHWPEGTADCKYVQGLDVNTNAHQEYGHQMQVCDNTPNAS
jgi:hypothetical protein